jgi:hypothetical protein
VTAAAALPARAVLPTFRHEPLFAGAAVVLALLSVPLLAALAIDGRTIGGEAAVLKPLKFVVALAVYLATLALYATWLPEAMRRSTWYRLYAAVVVAAIAAELAWIGGAAALGTTSHFNVATPLGGRLYGLMGILAVVLTSATLVYGVAIGRNPATGLPPSVRLALSLGLGATFVLTLVAAGGMASNLSHHVGTPVTGAAVPVLGWSREVGDLRIGHFLATHAMHAVPLAGVVAAALLPERLARAVVGVIAAGYAALTLAFVATAWAGVAPV